MKIRAVISGTSVHEVGYRVFLLNNALSEGVEGFSATNSVGPGNIQQVIILAEGDGEVIEEFSRVLKEQFPPLAEIRSVTIEPYEKRIIRILDYMHLAQVEQLDKGIPAILCIKSSQEKMVTLQYQMLDKQDQMLDKQDQMLDKQDQMLDKQDQMLDKQDQMLDKQDQMLGKQDQTTGEIRALRTDLKTEMNDRFNKVEMELQMIKEALHRSGILA